MPAPTRPSFESTGATLPDLTVPIDEWKILHRLRLQIDTALLDEIDLSNDVIAEVVAEVQRDGSPDPVALSRLGRERADVLQKLGRDRDVGAWEAATRRLDVEEAAARLRGTEGIPAEMVVEYLRELPLTWQQAKGGTGRRLLSETLFSEIRALGFREMEFELTSYAVRMGLGAALPSGPLAVSISGYGRGERDSPSLTQQTIPFLLINRTPPRDAAEETA